jgi:hypothetical protein
VLETGGIVRLAVPDLERTVREYIRILDMAAVGRLENNAEYNWIMLELLDQTVRYTVGGKMASFLQDLEVADRPYVLARIGAEAETFWGKQSDSLSKSAFKKMLSGDVWRRLFRRLREKIATQLVLLVAGKDAANSFRIGLFRNSGEVHQWMYDRYSLAKLLEGLGYSNVKICTATESSILKFNTYALDTTVNGSVRKPDSLYIEATKR